MPLENIWASTRIKAATNMCVFITQSVPTWTNMMQQHSGVVVAVVVNKNRSEAASPLGICAGTFQGKGMRQKPSGSHVCCTDDGLLSVLMPED